MTNEERTYVARIADALERIADVLDGPPSGGAAILDGPPRPYVAPLLPDAILPDARYGIGDHQP